MAAFRSAYGFCEWVEHELGWAVPSETEEMRRKALVAEAAKVKRRIAQDPALFTWDNLAVTTAWLRKQRRVTTPWGVLGHVQVALKATKTKPERRVSDIATAIAEAVSREQEMRAPGWESWVRRLTRAQGAGREAVYSEWEEQRENAG